VDNGFCWGSDDRGWGWFLPSHLPLTYHAQKAMEADPNRRSARAKRDEVLKVEIRRVWKENFELYGARKVWRQLLREGNTVARCTAAGLMGLEKTAAKGRKSKDPMSPWPTVGMWRGRTGRVRNGRWGGVFGVGGGGLDILGAPSARLERDGGQAPRL
jgi:hypothetical protein